MAKRYSKLAGWGKYVPQRVITNHDLEKMVDTSDEWIVARTGIRQRHIVSEMETASNMAVAAAREALAVADLAATDLDLIIIATSSPDYLIPPVSSQVQHQLGADKIGAMTLVTGCSGFVYALATASQFIESGRCDHVLVVGCEILSRFIDWSDRSTCILFGDGAGAVVVSASEEPGGVLSFVLGSDGEGAEHLILPGSGSTTVPTPQTIDDGLHYIQMDGRQVFRFATRIVGVALEEAIEQAGMTVDDIDLFIPHQANKRIIDAGARHVGLPEEKVFINIQNYGNTSAASIPIALCEAVDGSRVSPGDTLAFVAFGAGLTWAASVVRMGEIETPVAIGVDSVFAPSRLASLNPLNSFSQPNIVRRAVSALRTFITGNPRP